MPAPNYRLVDFMHRIETQYPTEYETLSQALEDFIELFDRRLISERTGSRTLTQLSRYLANKTKSLHPNTIAERAATLRALRNRLVHGRAVSIDELTSGYDALWTALAREAKSFNAADLFNLLTYSLRIPPNSLKISQNQSRMITAFRGLFKAMPAEEKERAFKELLVRLFSEPEFARALDQKRA